MTTFHFEKTKQEAKKLAFDGFLLENCLLKMKEKFLKDKITCVEDFMQFDEDLSTLKIANGGYLSTLEYSKLIKGLEKLQDTNKKHSDDIHSLYLSNKSKTIFYVKI